MGTSGPLLTGWLPDAERDPLWPGIYQLLLPAALYGDCAVLGDGDEVWIAVADKTVVGAVTARGLSDGNAEIMNVGGVNAARWWGQIEAQICQWARQNGARKIFSQGRVGWGRWIKHAGWKTTMNGTQALYEKDLT